MIGLLDGFDGQEQAKNAHDYVAGHALNVEAVLLLSPRDLPI